MGKLVYGAIMSLDGYIADESGDFGWAAPDEEVHAFVNDLQRSVGTYLFGRRMYEVMSFWEAPAADDWTPAAREFASVWQTTRKVVYSTSLPAVTTARTRLERRFEPASVRTMAAEADQDVAIGGPTLAAHAIRAGLVQDYQLFVVPVLVGAGTRCLPDGVRLDLELVDERRFDSGVVYLRYGAS
jgi:dihydrofolate reductase